MKSHKLFADVSATAALVFATLAISELINRFKFLVRAGFVATILVTLSGCWAAAPLLFEGTAVLADHQNTKFRNIEMTLGKNYTREDVKEIDTLAFFADGGASGNSVSSNFASGNTFLDNSSKEFIKKGYDIIEQDVLQAIMAENNLRPTAPGLAEAGKIAGLQGVFRLSVETAQDFNRGFFTIGSGFKTGIVGASMRLIDVNTSKVMLIMTATYKRAQKTSDVAKNMVEAFTAL